MLAELETRNCGKPIVESEFDIADTASCFEYYGGLATKIHGETLPVPDNAINMTLREPVGVAGLIVPWNYPLMLAAWKLGPALAAGCTVILKPAEQTPLTALEFARLCRTTFRICRREFSMSSPVMAWPAARSWNQDMWIRSRSLAARKRAVKFCAVWRIRI